MIMKSLGGLAHISQAGGALPSNLVFWSLKTTTVELSLLPTKNRQRPRRAWARNNTGKKAPRKQNERKEANAKTHFTWPREREESIAGSHPRSLWRPQLWCSTERSLTIFLSLHPFFFPLSTALCLPLPCWAPLRGLRSLFNNLFIYFKFNTTVFLLKW